jgi:hypothetical protein
MAFEGFSSFFPKKEGAITGEEINIESLKESDETFFALREQLVNADFTEFNNVNDAYRTLPAKDFIVRREDPRQVFELLSKAGSYNIDYVGDDPYSNCAVWNPRTSGKAGLENAYAEGLTELNHVVTIVGFRPHETDSLLQLPDAQRNFHGLERQYVRSFKGTVDTESIVFINLRIPAHLLPESELTEDELDMLFAYTEEKARGIKVVPVMVHRSYIKSQSEAFEGESYKKAA